MAAAHNLLVIDWDYFFPNPMDGGKYDRDTPLQLWDWSQREDLFHREFVWGTRVAAFLASDVPLPGLSGDQVGFWQRFSFTRHAQLYYADSNSLAASRHIATRGARFGQVWLYDAHHDAGYGGDEQLRNLGSILSKGQWDCSYWMILYWALGASLHLRYPRWKERAFEIDREPIVPVDRAFDDGSSPPCTFDRVFVCRSSAWVPPWLDMDQHLLDFIGESPLTPLIQLESIVPRVLNIDTDLLRDWHARIAATQS